MASTRDRVAELERRKAQAREMGGAERVKKQRERGKLDVRARIALLFDQGTFVEYGLLATDQGKLPDEDDPARPSPADGVVTGVGEVEGRMVGVAAYDFTVFGGSIGEVGERKVTRMREVCLKNRIPMVWLVDSGGARIVADKGRSRTASPGGGQSPQGDAMIDPKRIASFADTGYLFREQVVMSGVVPQVAAMVGPGAAGTAYIPGLADFVPMVKGTSSIAIGGPYLVESTVGEVISEEELGGSKIHNDLSGVADQEHPSDEACLAAIRSYLGFFPSSCEEKPPIRETKDPVTRRDEALLDLVPDNPRRAYDMKKVLSILADDGFLFEMKPKWAKNIVTCLARVGGRPVGFVASNPMFYGGALDVNASDKAARFVNLCDAFNVPLVFFQDVPGFMVGSKVEKEGIIRHGAKMLYAVATATVPKITVVVRKAYGAGYYVMCGRAYEPDLIVAWPNAEIALMGPEGMVSIGARKMLMAAPEGEARKQLKAQMADMLRPSIDIFRAGALGYVDDVIDPRDTRAVIYHALKRTQDKRVERPHRKREVSPV